MPLASWRVRVDKLRLILIRSLAFCLFCSDLSAVSAGKQFTAPLQVVPVLLFSVSRRVDNQNVLLV